MGTDKIGRDSPVFEFESEVGSHKGQPNIKSLSDIKEYIYNILKR